MFKVSCSPVSQQCCGGKARRANNPASVNAKPDIAKSNHPKRQIDRRVLNQFW